MGNACYLLWYRKMWTLKIASDADQIIIITEEYIMTANMLDCMARHQYSTVHELRIYAGIGTNSKRRENDKSLAS